MGESLYISGMKKLKRWVKTILERNNFINLLNYSQLQIYVPGIIL